MSDEVITIGAAFIRFRKDLLNQFNPTADLTNSPTERNWVAAFGHVDEKLPSQEYCDHRGGTQEAKAERMFLTCAAYKKRSERGVEWVAQARKDKRPVNIIPFPYKHEPKTNVIPLMYGLQKNTA